MQVYGFGNVGFFINGVQITGFAKGDDVIKVRRRTPSASDEVGADGRMVVSVSSDKSGEFTIKLQQSSPSNAYLMKLLTAMEVSATGYVPIAAKMQDMYRNDLAAGALGYIAKLPDLSRGEKATDQEWVIVVENLVLLFGEKILATLT